jgi:hypothetical protein
LRRPEVADVTYHLSGAAAGTATLDPTDRLNHADTLTGFLMQYYYK